MQYSYDNQNKKLYSHFPETYFLNLQSQIKYKEKTIQHIFICL